ncbi:hypothetical protein [Legionella bozemanae]|uniref:hypothetical protein n=1 Tax=Legionella bozemanae TaxID=447 RepID=UPI00399CA0B0
MPKKYCYKIKLNLNVVKIPAAEREDNIYAIYGLFKSELFNEPEKGIPPIINEIKEIIENIDLECDVEISKSILEIKRRIRTSDEHFLNPNIRDFLEVLGSKTTLTYRAIRIALSIKNEAMEKILVSYP